jgi:hypothetical protein
MRLSNLDSEGLLIDYSASLASYLGVFDSLRLRAIVHRILSEQYNGKNISSLHDPRTHDLDL